MGGVQTHNASEEPKLRRPRGEFKPSKSDMDIVSPAIKELLKAQEQDYDFLIIRRKLNV